MTIKNRPTVWIEQGTVLSCTLEMQGGLHAIKRLYCKKNKDLYITSGSEGDHLMYSFHYDGKAVDIKKNGITKRELQKALGPKFQVIPYSWGYHIELDPPKG